MNRIVIALFLALLCHPGSADEPLKPVMLYISFSQSLETDVPTPGKRRYPGLAVVNGSTVSFTPEAVSAHQVRAWRESSRHSEQFASVRVTPMLVNETVSLNVSGSEHQAAFTITSELKSQEDWGSGWRYPMPKC